MSQQITKTEIDRAIRYFETLHRYQRRSGGAPKQEEKTVLKLLYELQKQVVEAKQGGK